MNACKLLAAVLTSPLLLASLDQDDYSLSAFSIANDRRYILPVLQKALEIRKTFVRPEEGVLPLYIMGSPWSPPAWSAEGPTLRFASRQPLSP